MGALRPSPTRDPRAGSEPPRSGTGPFPEPGGGFAPLARHPPGVGSRGRAAGGRVVWGKRERVCRNQAEVGAVTAEMQGASERAGPAAPRLAPQLRF